jgi:hypothetical protein
MALDFDPNEYDSADTLQIVPRGAYRVKVVRIDAKPALGEFDPRRNYVVWLEIIKGEHAGCLLKEYLPLHGTEKWEGQIDRARSRLKNLMWATYHERINDIEDLLDQECEVEAWINEGIDKNGVKKWDRKNEFRYVIPDDFTRPTKSRRATPKTNGGAEPDPFETNPPRTTRMRSAEEINEEQRQRNAAKAEAKANGETTAEPTSEKDPLAADEIPF